MGTFSAVARYFLREWNGPKANTLLPLCTATRVRMALDTVPEFQRVLRWLDPCTNDDAENRDHCRLTVIPRSRRYP
eukprot:8432109-Pyramimonas_sp.AAC.1